MRRPRSLRGRLSLAAVLMTALSLAGLTIVFVVVLGHQLRTGADDLLRSRAAATAAGIEVTPQGTLRLERAPEDREIGQTTWVFEGMRVLARAPGDEEEQQAAARLAGVGERTVQSDEPEAVRYYALPVRQGDRQVGTVVSSVVLDPYERVEDTALLAAVALSVLALGGAYLLTRTLIGRALTPVAEMTEQAAHWSSTDLERRFGTGERPTELAALAATLDGVLDRLAAVLRHEQQLSAELSHELRTPLSAVVAEVELLQARPRTPAELEEGHAAVLSAAERMSRVLESLLTTARASRAAPGRCEVLPAVRAAVDSVDPPPGAVVLQAPAAPVHAGVDAALLERALAPVLDNALRHRTGCVTVEVGHARDGPWVRVADDGPGVPPELTETLFDPGVSGGPAHGGAGLGLALARRLARAGGGELALEPDRPGASFLLTVPPG